MSFELAAVLFLAVVACGLGMACYHLLGRLEQLERSVQGGLTPPSTRLSREQFERRFRTAHARSALAQEVGMGVLLIVGPEHASSQLSKTVDQLARRDHLTVKSAESLDLEALGISTTPYLFVVDDEQVRTGRPIAGSPDLVDALKEFA